MPNIITLNCARTPVFQTGVQVQVDSYLASLDVDLKVTFPSDMCVTVRLPRQAIFPVRYLGLFRQLRIA